MDVLTVLNSLVKAVGPVGQEDEVRDLAAQLVGDLGFKSEVDPKGNLLVPLAPEPQVVVTAHLDEIALMVRAIEEDGRLRVVPLGGLHPWKWGEGLVEILGTERITGVLSFGSIHTEDPSAPAVQARQGPLLWEHASVLTGLTTEQLFVLGVRPGTRVALHPSRRGVSILGMHLSSFFLDDRADLLAWLLALEELKDQELPVLFAATVREETGGEGANYLLQRLKPEICVALELGPAVPDSPISIDENPCVWASDSYSMIDPRDVALLEASASQLELGLQWQVLSRGGSDASCAASLGHVARPVTLGIPMENSHGYEVMHRDAPAKLAELTVEYLYRLFT